MVAIEVNVVAIDAIGLTGGVNTGAAILARLVAQERAGRDALIPSPVLLETLQPGDHVVVVCHDAADAARADVAARGAVTRRGIVAQLDADAGRSVVARRRAVLHRAILPRENAPSRCSRC